MSASLSQAQRIATLTTPLGKDKLALSRLEGTEGVSQLFEFRIDALSTERDIDFDGAIGKNCSVEMKTYKGSRHFDGILTEAQFVGGRDHLFAYRLVLRPWLWLLGHTSDCRLFKQKKPNDIIKEVFNKAGFSDFSFKTNEDYPTLEYCVQYRETHLAFVCRLMEQFGMFYLFEFSDGKHTLVVADSKSSLKKNPNVSTVPLILHSSTNRRTEEHFSDWTKERRFRTGKVALNDYDYFKPNANLLANASESSGYARGSLEVYDYPGKYDETGQGEKFAKVRLQATQSLDKRRRGSGDAASMTPGHLVTLKDHPAGGENIEYMVVSATHSYTAQDYRSGGGSSGSPYAGAYVFQPGDRPFRAPLVTPKPVMFGPQTAKVVGKRGEEIDVDEHGRIEVQFHWDREKKHSRRVRIAHVWSGKNWGGVVIPRIGMEVVVEFLEGDPDQPFVTGTVYNADNTHPYALPENKTMAGLKSNSSKGGGGYNEFVFEDKKSSEKVRMHAQKDHEVVVRNMETVEIGVDFDAARDKGSRKHTLKNGDDELTVDKGNQKVKIKADQIIDVNENIKTTAKQSIFMTATTSIELKCGASKITMTPAEIKIESMIVKIEAQTVLDAKGLMTTVDGTAVLTLKGGMVKIN